MHTKIEEVKDNLQAVYHKTGHKETVKDSMKAAYIKTAYSEPFEQWLERQCEV